MINYTASRTVDQFMADRSFIRGLKGPVGSGKSVGCVMELLQLAMEHPQSYSDQFRHSRWVVVRNTYRELKDTTLNTWNDWIQPPIAKWVENTHTSHVQFNDIKADFLFRALDKPDDVKKLLSLELTGGWINEAKEVPRGVLDMLQTRVGRFPRRADCPPFWNGIIMDTNPPDVDHWWYRMFEEKRPDGWKIFSQPSGLAEDAENIENLPGGRNYYERLVASHDQEWINVYVHGKYGFVKDGKPIYPEYVDTVHCREFDDPSPNQIIWVGVDFGRTPAATFSYYTPAGGRRTFDELVTEDMGAMKFGDLLADKMRRDFRGYKFSVHGDPSGDTMTQVDDTTPFDVLQAKGIPIDPAPTNDPIIRRDAIGRLLTRMDMSGNPMMLIHPRCKILRKGMAGGYKFRRLQVTGDERFHDKPDKNMYSHVCEADQYGALGSGEGDQVIMEAPALRAKKRFGVKPAAEHYGRGRDRIKIPNMRPDPWDPYGDGGYFS